jgi:hypothetical protein
MGHLAEFAAPDAAPRKKVEPCRAAPGGLKEKAPGAAAVTPHLPRFAALIFKLRCGRKLIDWNQPSRRRCEMKKQTEIESFMLAFGGEKPTLTKSEIKEFTNLTFQQYAFVEEGEVQNLKGLIDDLFVFEDADEVYALLRRFRQILSRPKRWAAWRDEQRRGGGAKASPLRPALHVVK